MKILNSVILILPLFFTMAAKAQTSISKLPTEPKTSNVRIDGTSILLKGFGIGLGKSLSKKTNTSVFYSQHKLEDEETSKSLSSLGPYSAVHKVQEYGVRADLYPLTSYEEGGFYTSLQAVRINLETAVDPVFSDKETILRTDKTGLRLFLGYEAKDGNLRKISSALNVGLGYGTGGSYSNNLGGTKNEILDALNIEAAYTFMF